VANAASLTFAGNSTLQAGGATDVNVNRLVTVNSGVTGTLDTNGQALSIEGTVTGAGSLAELGAGILTLNGASNFTGGVTLNAGTLNIGNAAALGTGTLTVNGGSFDNTIGANANITYTANTSNVTISGANGTAGNGIKITYLNNGANTPLAINSTSSGTNIIVNLGTNAAGSVISNATQIVSLINSNATANAVVNATLAGANNTGAGFITALAQTSLSGGSASNTATLTTTLGANATLANNPLLLNGNVTYVGSATGLNLGTGSVTLSTTPSITVSNNSLTIDGVISGAGLGFTKLGNGTLVLGGSDTYSGITSVSGGTMTLDFTQTGAPTNNILSTASTLALGGGSTLNVIGKTTNTQSVTTNPLLGGSNLTLTNGTGVLTVNLGTITRSPGGSINIGASSIVNNLVYTAANVGTNGNNIIINYVNGSGNNVATTASVTSNTVTVTLGTNGTGTVNATAAQVAAAINANATVTNLVKVSNVGSGNVVAGSSTLSLGNATVAASNTTVLTPDDVVTTITGTQGFILADPNSTAPYAVITFPVNSNATFNGTTTDFAAIGPGGTIVPYSTIASYYGDTAAQAALVKTGLLAPSVGNNPTDNTDIPLTNQAITVTNSYDINTLRFNQPNNAPGNSLNINGNLGVNGILVSANVADFTSPGAAPIIGGSGNLMAGNPGGELSIFTYGNFGAGISSLYISSNIIDNTLPSNLTKAGDGNLTLTGTNTFTGAFYADDGRGRDPEHQQPGRQLPVRFDDSHGEHWVHLWLRRHQPAKFRHGPERGDIEPGAARGNEQHRDGHPHRQWPVGDERPWRANFGRQ
jgi:autotransporter-associated beta strand protein